MENEALMAEYNETYAKFEKFVAMNTGLSLKGAEKLIDRLCEMENALFGTKA